MSLSASFLGDCCLPDISSSRRVAEICAGSLTTELAVAAAERERRGGRARLTGAGEAALMTMVAAAAGTEEAEGAPPVDAAGSRRGEVATAWDWPFPIPGKGKYKLTH